MPTICTASPIDCYAKPEVLADLQARFGYVFKGIDMATAKYVYRPWLIPHEIAGPFAVNGIPVEPYAQDHGYGQTTTGFRFGRVAYSTDVLSLPEESLARLEGLDLWVVGCLMDRPHQTHADLATVLGWIDRLKPRLAVLVHMSPRLDYAELAARVPAGVVPAYDGMAIEV